MNEAELWRLFPIAYLFTVLVETPVLFVGLARKHTWKDKLIAGVWLTACTYPVVWPVLPSWFDLQSEYVWYLIVAETFAPVAECLLFSLAWGWRKTNWRDWLAIVAANLASFGLGKLLDPTLQSLARA